MRPTGSMLPLEEIASLAYGSKKATYSPDIEHCSTSKEVMEYSHKRSLNIGEFEITDILGRRHHFSMPIH